MKYLTSTLFIIFIIPFQLLYSQYDLNNELINKHFTDSEKIGLEKIISFVDSSVLSESSNSEINYSYHSFLDTIRDNNRYFSYNEESKYHFIFSLDSSLFNKIWLIESFHRKVRANDSTYENVSFPLLLLNYKGEFVKMLGEIKDSNNYYKNLYDRMQYLGGPTSPDFTDFLNKNYTFDFQNIFNRLWVAILLLSLEESYEYKVKKYLIN